MKLILGTCKQNLSTLQCWTTNPIVFKRDHSFSLVSKIHSRENEKWKWRNRNFLSRTTRIVGNFTYQDASGNNIINCLEIQFYFNIFCWTLWWIKFFQISLNRCNLVSLVGVKHARECKVKSKANSTEASNISIETYSLELNMISDVHSDCGRWTFDVMKISHHRSLCYKFYFVINNEKFPIKKFHIVSVVRVFKIKEQRWINYVNNLRWKVCRWTASDDYKAFYLDQFVYFFVFREKILGKIFPTL